MQSLKPKSDMKVFLCENVVLIIFDHPGKARQFVETVKVKRLAKQLGVDLGLS